MGKIRHIAYRSEDPEAMMQFFVNAFEMELIQRRGNGAIDISDGTLQHHHPAHVPAPPPMARLPDRASSTWASRWRMTRPRARSY